MSMRFIQFTQVIYTLPEIVSENQISIFFILLKGSEEILEFANVWFSRFPYFIVNFCSELQCAVEKK